MSKNCCFPDFMTEHLVKCLFWAHKSNSLVAGIHQTAAAQRWSYFYLNFLWIELILTWYFTYKDYIIFIFHIFQSSKVLQFGVSYSSLIKLKKVRSLVKRDFGYFLLISVDQIHSDSVKKNGSFFMIFFIQLKSRH